MTTTPNRIYALVLTPEQEAAEAALLGRRARRAYDEDRACGTGHAEAFRMAEAL